MAKFKVGDKVRYVDEAGHRSNPCYYPAVGTIGEIKDVVDVVDVLGVNYWVQWPEGTTSYNDYWCCGQHRLELVTEGGTADA